MYLYTYYENLGERRLFKEKKKKRFVLGFAAKVCVGLKMSFLISMFPQMFLGRHDVIIPVMLHLFLSFRKLRRKEVQRNNF